MKKRGRKAVLFTEDNAPQNKEGTNQSANTQNFFRKKKVEKRGRKEKHGSEKRKEQKNGVTIGGGGVGIKEVKKIMKKQTGAAGGSRHQEKTIS